MKNEKITAGILSIITILSGFFLASIKVKADALTDYVAVFIPNACTLSSSIDEEDEHNAEMLNGTYRENIGKTNLGIICNDPGGFSIYAVGDTNNQYGNTVLGGTTVGATSDIPTGTATSGDESNWAMKLSTNTEIQDPISILNGFSSYSAVPATYTKVASKQSGIGVGSQDANVETTYAAYVSSTQLADTYIGQVKYVLVHPSNNTPPEPKTTEPGYIAYYPNTGIYEGSMGEQSLSSTDTSATLLASNFSRDGYGFAGWNTEYDYSGDFYGPNETISFEAGQYTNGENGLSLYAVWIESEGILQNWTGCNTLSPVLYNSTTGIINADMSSITALTDLRDNQTYAIARLADGKCWMIENLRLSSESSLGDLGKSLAQGYGESDNYGNFIGLANSENNNFNTTLSNSIYGIDNSSSVVVGTNDYPIYRIPRFNSANTTNRATSPSNVGVGYYSYGNYYNWSAAMASTKYYTSGYLDNGQERDQSNLANTSLCPSGWRLPYGSDARGRVYDGEISILDLAMGGSGLSGSINNITGESMSYYWRKFPNNLIYSGSINGSAIESRGSNGYLWTTTASDYDRAYGLSINNAYVNPGADSYIKYSGFSIRCISQHNP